MKVSKCDGKCSNFVNQNDCREGKKMKTVVLKFLCIILPIIVVVSGCSKDPASPEPVNTKPKDGYWSGSTNQNKDVTFSVCEKGTEVDSGFVIHMYISESWGYGHAKYTRIVPTNIENEEFSFDGGGISVQGEFDKRTACSGNFALAGTTGYPYYFPFSVSGTWDAEWSATTKPLETILSSDHTSLEKGLNANRVEQQIDEYSKVTVTYYLVK
jgi:hypothetical protein